MSFREKLNSSRFYRFIFCCAICYLISFADIILVRHGKMDMQWLKDASFLALPIGLLFSLASVKPVAKKDANAN